MQIALTDALGFIEKQDNRIKELSDERDATKTLIEQYIKELELLKLSEAAAAAKAKYALAERDAVAADLGWMEESLQVEREKVSSLAYTAEIWQERLESFEDENAAVADDLERSKDKVSTLEYEVSCVIAENDDLKERLKDSETKLEIMSGTLQKVKAAVSNQHPDNTMEANACEYFAPSNIAFSHYLSAKLIISALLW